MLMASFELSYRALVACMWPWEGGEGERHLCSGLLGSSSYAHFTNRALTLRAQDCA